MHRLTILTVITILVTSASTYGADEALDDDIREIVFRYQFREFAAGNTPKARCISFSSQEDPPASFLARFRNHSPPVLARSECERRFPIGRDPLVEPYAAMFFFISNVGALPDGRYSATGGYMGGRLEGARGVFVLELQDRHWVVKEFRVHAIS